MTGPRFWSVDPSALLGDFRIRTLTPAEAGCFFRWCLASFQNSGTLPSDPRILATIAEASEADVRATLDRVVSLGLAEVQKDEARFFLAIEGHTQAECSINKKREAGRLGGLASSAQAPLEQRSSNGQRSGRGSGKVKSLSLSLEGSEAPIHGDTTPSPPPAENFSFPLFPSGSWTPSPEELASLVRDFPDRDVPALLAKYQQKIEAGSIGRGTAADYFSKLFHLIEREYPPGPGTDPPISIPPPSPKVPRSGGGPKTTREIAAELGIDLVARP